MESTTEHNFPQGYILKNRITHLRGLPVSSAHAFRYSTLSFLLNLDALESGKLDLASGWVFGYGGRWARILGLRSKPYLDTLSSASIRQKLEDELRKHGMLRHDETFRDAWMMTMPSILGFESINPLTVYFCYKDTALWTVVFEIHNTFSESHIHLLEVGKNEDQLVTKGYDHQWTFPRQFHVSPFNDRTGFYTVSIKFPAHSPRSDTLDVNAEPSIPLPAVCIRLYTDPEPDPCPNSALSTTTLASNGVPPVYGRPSVGKLKLAAYLRATTALPLTTGNVIRELAKQPLVLFLTMPRILYHAWILHFSKRLDVFPRPEPHNLKLSNSADKAVPGGGVGWQEETFLESFARRRVTEFLHRRVCETGVSVQLIPSNPNIPVTKIPAVGNKSKTSILEISYLSPRFFTIIFTCPSAEHALLLGSDAEGIFQASSADLFNATFSSATEIHEANPKSSFLQTTLQTFRQARVPDSLAITIPTTHFLDADRSVASLIASTLVLWSLALFDYVEKAVFQFTGSRFVEGQEPWNAWKRAVELYSNKRNDRAGRTGSPFVVYGSVRRDS